MSRWQIFLIPWKKLRHRPIRSFFSLIFSLQIALLLIIYYFVFYSDYDSGSGGNDITTMEGSTNLTRSLTRFNGNKININWHTLTDKLNEDEKNKAAIVYRKMIFDTDPLWIDDFYLNKNLLTIPFGPGKGNQVGDINDLKFYNTDPRLTWSVYLNHILNLDNDNTNSKNVKLPFSWYDWADFRNFNKLVSVKDKFNSSINCNLIFKHYIEKDLVDAMEVELGEPLFNIDRDKYKDKFWYRRVSNENRKASDEEIKTFCKDNSFSLNDNFNVPFKVNEIYPKVRPEVYSLSARNFLLNSYMNPTSITILESHKNSYRFDLVSEKSENMVQSHLLEQFIKSRRNDDNNDDILFDHLPLFNDFIKSDVSKNFLVEIPQTSKDIYDKDSIELDIEDFIFDVKAKIDELQSNFDNLDTHSKNYLDSLKYSYSTNMVFAPKHLEEAKQLLGKNGHHRDKRFYNGADSEERILNKARMNTLIRTFQKFVKSNGLISWLSHGTLYSHLYNGLAFPWDGDFDIQMPLSHLHYLAQYYNQSLIMEDPREGNGRFLLDITSSITVRTVSNGLNNIDARFVDIDSGIYIDITGLSVSTNRFVKGKTEIVTKDQFVEAIENLNSLHLQSLPDPDEGEGFAKMTLGDLKMHFLKHKDEYPSVYNQLLDFITDQEARYSRLDEPYAKVRRKDRFYLYKKLKLVNCRNSHFSRLDMISPLKPTLYHGMPALVPNKVISTLKNEYKVPANFGFLNYVGMTFLPRLKLWLEFPDLKLYGNVNNAVKSMLPLTSPLNKLKFFDMPRLFQNMIIGEFTNIISYVVTTFDVTNFRIKEMEIMLSKLPLDAKRNYLKILRREVGPKLQSPMKDPILYEYEEHIWKKFSKNMNEKERLDLETGVKLEVAEELCRNYTEFYSDNWFKQRLPDTINGAFDMDRIGVDIYDDISMKKNNLFLVDWDI